MPVVGFGESTRYALRLYGYVLVALVVGVGSVGLGAALLWPEVRAWRGPGEAAVAPGVAGGVLVVIGFSILLVGSLGSTYKLLADSVAAGAGARDPESSDTSNGAADATGTAPDQGDDETPRESEVGEGPPPEPSPSEIAFGSDGVDEGTLPGGDGPEDPLRNRSE